ncbi:uncharacterized protein N7500_000363 [Penicillium coprophilum]|uniref:uncharacterized protein n=1 Tax=Penicillium coprophilum TaxID=36646 RepID=UPI0023A5B4E6|nr:uncharacterized protein N7500_000363 [Penicillium coprophilum]KAJ5177664.1 hypothetical protein N7500_000363 [Penicillium coprophilum]
MDAGIIDSMACQTPIAIDGRLGRAHFAHISIDKEGSLHLQCSQSIAKTFQGPLYARLADTFLKAVTMSEEVCSPATRASPPQTAKAITKASPPLESLHTPHKTGSDDKDRTQNSAPTSLSPPEVGPAHEAHSPRRDTQGLERTKRNVWSKENRMWRPEVTIPIRDRDFLRLYYEKAFQTLQQSNCRVLAKAYIKLVEPRKQVCFPYNGRAVVTGVIRQLDPEVAKPPWWPPGVRHREPDHLLKEERIKLLVHILCELRTSHSITTKLLREADQQIRRYIVPAERVCILDEIYRVRQEEIELLEGKSDGQRQVWICRMNLPEAPGTASNDNEHYEDAIPFDAVPTTTSNSPSSHATPGSISNAPLALLASDPTLQPALPLDHPYNVHCHIPRKYASPDPNAMFYDMNVPISMPPHRFKRKRDVEEIGQNDVTRGAMTTPYCSPSATNYLQSCSVENYGGPFSSLQHGFVSPGPFTAEALTQPSQGCDMSHHFGYL